jgi:DNA-binding transcriptional ArsR family regulator
MLTISKPLSAGQAQTYHQKEFTAKEQNYWSQQGVIAGDWQGRLAGQFRLAGAQIAPQRLWPQGPRKKESVSNSAGLTQSTVSDLFAIPDVSEVDCSHVRSHLWPSQIMLQHCASRRSLLQSHGCVRDNAASLMERPAQDEFLKRWANEKRLLIFKSVASDKETSAITSLNGVSPATVSQGLKILSDAALIRCRRRGQFVHNRMLPKAIENYLCASYSISRTESSSGFSRTELRGPHVPRPEFGTKEVKQDADFSCGCG